VLQLGRGQERHLAFDNAGSAKALGRVAVKPATRHRGVEDLAEDLGGVADAAGAQSGGHQPGLPLMDRQGVDRRQGRPAEALGGRKNAGAWPGYNRNRRCIGCHRDIYFGERCETCKRELIQRRKRKPP